MRIPLCSLFLLGACCAYPSHSATRTVDLTLPAAGLVALQCTSHNGDIEVLGNPAATEVRLHAELSARGHSEAEADDNLRQMRVAHEFVDGKLRIAGEHPEGMFWNFSPSFAFRLEVPAQVAVTLTSHNGGLKVRGTRGEQRLETHNGGVDAEVDARQMRVETHNGRIALDVRTQGPVDGTILSHNGGVDVRLAEGASTTLTASTHNGDITPPERMQDARMTERSLRARIGDGTGALSVTTHNGDVRIR
jgi:hypothetical protein